MVGRDAVAEQRQHAGARDVGDRAGLGRDVLEIGRLPDVGAGLVPVVDLAAGAADLGPALVALEDVGIGIPEHAMSSTPLSDRRLDVGRARPDVAQVDRLAVAAGAERLAGQVDLRRLPASA